jgi:hypothetical protein
MQYTFRVSVRLFLALMLAVLGSACSSGSSGANSPEAEQVGESDDAQNSSNASDDTSSDASVQVANAVDANETEHLIFMREEEKLARDVYTTLGMLYPQLKVFGNISKSEEAHTCAVCEKLKHYGLEDPVVNDNVGVFSGVAYGAYFTEKFKQLVDRGEVSELEALYVGGFIEELDMLDIEQCPKAIIDADNGIESFAECGRMYTDNEDIIQLYTSLLEGSENHLRAFVSSIEKRIGEGNYQAQILEPSEVDAILNR